VLVGEDPGRSGDQRATEVREHLANERTLLSWVRTGVGLISLGIVVERAGSFVSAGTGNADRLSGLLGMALTLLGCLALVLGTVQFLRNRRRISRGEFVPQAAIYLIVVGGGLILGGCFAAYVLYTLLAG
jgi:putative membrane protein